MNNSIIKKNLRSCTIIPPHLYVERSADTQLQRVIADMGRPGYILVARQMGKTNLLLHTKEILSNKFDKLLYIDISNIFPEIRDFFQNIINVFLDSQNEIDSEVGNTIRADRLLNLSLTAHKEHENELRKIIKCMSGNLVICFDEIDAITKTAYSDQVFSFIRSIYFSGRTNIPEFKRLTYVLSGVAEPTELIKDKAVSPFNIGEKIYLDDFTLSELNNFIDKSGLVIQDEIINRIFYWTNGNPRISWDLCSAIEDFIIDNGQISIDSVDTIVHKIYLTNFDIPPIDHIRTLVEDDKVVREAVMQIHYGKSEHITDALRNRLYLSGICQPSDNGIRTVKIKNRIIAESLSEQWIKDVERREIPLYELANREFDAKRYAEALSLYNEYLESTNSPQDQLSLYYNLGTCHFNLKQYQDAIRNFENCVVSKDALPAIYYAIRKWIGLSYLILADYKNSCDQFRIILQQDVDSGTAFHYYDTCVNLSQALFYNFDENQEEIISLNQKVIDSQLKIHTTQGTNSPSNPFLTFAHFNLARSFKFLGNTSLSLEHIEKAQSFSAAQEQSYLYFHAAKFSDSASMRRELLVSCVDSIIKNKLIFLPNSDIPSLKITAETCSDLIACLANESLTEQLDIITLHLNREDLSHNLIAGDIILAAASNCVNNANQSGALDLITRAKDLPHQDGKLKRFLVGISYFMATSENRNGIFQSYWDTYLNSDDSKINDFDYRLIWNVIRTRIARKEFDIAERTIVKFRNILLNSEKMEDGDVSISMYHKGIILMDKLILDVNMIRYPNQEHYNFAKDIYERFIKVENLNLPYFEPEFSNDFEKNINKIILFTKKVKTIRREGKKYGRNETVTVKFGDNKYSTGKYKRFEKSLLNNECVLIDSLSDES